MGGKDYQFIRSIYRHIFIPPPFWRDRGVNLRWTPTPEKKKPWIRACIIHFNKSNYSSLFEKKNV